MTGSSKRVILVCEECDERTVLGEPLAAWYSEGTHFGCECGRRLTIADRLDLQTVSRAGASRAWRGRPGRYTVEVRASGNSPESPTADRRKETIRIDDVLSIIALGACLIALAACAVAHYLSALV